jgi:predicted small lipoprotein YifL
LTVRSTQKLPLAILAGTLLLAGCGVKGPLEPPVGAENTAAPNPLQTKVVPDTSGTSVTSTPTQTATSADPNAKTSMTRKSRLKQGNVPVTSQPEKPDQRFILDDLL